MSFGIFTKGQNESLDYAQQHLAEDLPLEFSDAFDAAWQDGLLFGQSVSSSTARMQGVQEYLDGLREKTGTTFVNPAFAPLGGSSAALDELNGQIAALAPKFPELGLKPLTAEDLDRLGEEKARRARQAYRKAAAREQTWGGTAGLLLGSLSAGAADPVNIVTMSIVDYIDKLVKTGQIADEALGLYERSRGEFGRTMGPASAEAAAGLAAARALESSAKRLKNDTAKQALAWANAERRVLSHPQGRVAGVMAMLTRDIWEAGGENVATKGEVIWAQLSAKFGQAPEAYSPGIAGQSRQQIAGVRNLVRELFDVETGDGMAKAAAAGWKAAEKEGSDRILAAGRNVPLAEEWRLPQFWDTLRVRAFTREEFKADFAAELDRGALTLWDRDTGAPAKAEGRRVRTHRHHALQRRPVRRS